MKISKGNIKSIGGVEMASITSGGSAGDPWSGLWGVIVGVTSGVAISIFLALRTPKWRTKKRESEPLTPITNTSIGLGKTELLGNRPEEPTNSTSSDIESWSTV